MTTQQAPPPAAMPALSPTMSFDDASRAVLDFLGKRLPWAFWSITRVENGKQTYLHLGDNEYGLEEGGSHAWNDSFCIKMVSGEGPRIAPDVSRVPVYSEQPIAQAIQIGAYAGAPINDQDGTLFGALCGLNKTAVGEEAVEEGPLLELLCQLLGMVLAADRTQRDIEYAAQRARLEADTDALTGVYSRRGWDSVVDAEELHQQVYADPAVVVMIDLDGLKKINDQQGHAAGDNYIRRCAKALKGTLRDSDPVARIGGDEFAVLLRSTSTELAPKQVVRLRTALAAAGVAASIGWAPHTLSGGFPKAQAAADAAMYEDKLLRRGALTASGARGR